MASFLPLHWRYLLGTNAQAHCSKDDESCAQQEDKWTEEANSDDPNLQSYQNYFDENGKFKADLFNKELPKDEFEIQESSQREGDTENVEYNHIKTPNYTIVLNSAYEDNLQGEQFQCLSREGIMFRSSFDEQISTEVRHGRVRGGEHGPGGDGERYCTGGHGAGGETEDEHRLLRSRLQPVHQWHDLREQIPARPAGWLVQEIQQLLHHSRFPVPS